MSHELLKYYNQELEYLRQSGAEFSKAHPKVATSLGMDNNGYSDPMVLRLVQSFAFLTAKMQRQLDADHSELAYDLISQIYPQMLLPLPSMAIMKFEPKKQMSKPFVCKKGQEYIPKDEEQKDVVLRVTNDAPIVPLTVVNVDYIKSHELKQKHPGCIDQNAYLKIRLKKSTPEVKLDELPLLRFYINVQKQFVESVYALLFSNVHQVLVVDGDGRLVLKQSDVSLDKVGYDEDQALLPYPGNAFSGYRLLSEYCVFPEKFQFFSLGGLSLEQSIDSDFFDVLIGFDQYQSDCQTAFFDQSLALNCLPVINLYETQTDPMRVDHLRSSYPLDCDGEIYSIQAMKGWRENGDPLTFRMRYGLNFSDKDNPDITLYQPLRMDYLQQCSQGPVGGNVHVCFSYQGAAVLNVQPWTVSTTVLAFNAAVSGTVDFSAIPSPRFSLSLVKKLTPVMRPKLTQHYLTGVVHALTALQQSLLSEEGGVEAIQQLLHLFNFCDDEAIQSLINSLVQQRVERIARRYPGDHGLVFVQGIRLTLVFNERVISASMCYLFASILSVFLNQFTALNSFIELSMTNTKGEWEETWAPMCGQQQLI